MALANRDLDWDTEAGRREQLDWWENLVPDSGTEAGPASLDRVSLDPAKLVEEVQQ